MRRKGGRGRTADSLVLEKTERRTSSLLARVYVCTFHTYPSLPRFCLRVFATLERAHVGMYIRQSNRNRSVCSIWLGIKRDRFGSPAVSRFNGNGIGQRRFAASSSFNLISFSGWECSQQYENMNERCNVAIIQIASREPQKVNLQIAKIRSKFDLISTY